MTSTSSGCMSGACLTGLGLSKPWTGGCGPLFDKQTKVYVKVQSPVADRSRAIRKRERQGKAMAIYRVEEAVLLVFEIEANSADEAMEKWGEADSNDAISHDTQRVTVIGEDGAILQDD